MSIEQETLFERIEQQAALIARIQAALGTATEGDALVEVARIAHKAERTLWALQRRWRTSTTSTRTTTPTRLCAGPRAWKRFTTAERRRMTMRYCPSHRTPFDEDDGVTMLQEQILSLLEDAGIDTETNDKIIALVSDRRAAPLRAGDGNPALHIRSGQARLHLPLVSRRQRHHRPAARNHQQALPAARLTPDQTRRMTPNAQETDMHDPTENIRRRMVAKINADPGSREALSAVYGEVYDTAEMQEAFTVEAFMAPFVIVTRKSDGKRGSLLFQHHPRFYYRFTPD